MPKLVMVPDNCIYAKCSTNADRIVGFPPSGANISGSFSKLRYSPLAPHRGSHRTIGHLIHSPPPCCGANHSFGLLKPSDFAMFRYTWHGSRALVPRAALAIWCPCLLWGLGLQVWWLAEMGLQFLGGEELKIFKCSDRS